MEEANVSVSPSSLQFNLGEEEPVATLKIKNNIGEKIAFKIKTTEPKRYLVRPNQDVLAEDDECTVKIILQRRERSALVKDHSNGNQPPSPDKFLVQTTTIDSQFYQVVRDSNVKAQTSSMQQMWKTKDRKDIQNTKLQCSFEFPKMSPVKSMAEGAAPFATPVGAGAAPGQEESAEATTLIGLRQKYHELVQFTVQLTAERDHFKTLAKDAKKELKLFRENVGAARSDAVEKLGESLDGSGERRPTVRSSSGFSLWHILLAAIMSFLFARLIAQQQQ